MRWLFALLLLLNAGFFIWQYSMQESSKARPATALALPPDSSIKPLVLLREAPLNAPGSAPGNTPAAEAVMPPEATGTNTTEDLASQVPPTPTASCYTIGPFITAQEAQRASVLLKKEGLIPHLRAGGTTDNPEHWLDAGNRAESSPAPISETLWQTLTSTFSNIQQQPRPCH